jgi:hypothetical protein
MAGKGVTGTLAATRRSAGELPPSTPKEASDCGPGLLGEDVAYWPFPPLWLPVGNEGGDEARGTWPGGLDRASATTLDAPATC